MKRKLSIKNLIKCAEAFCKEEDSVYYSELFGATDGKRVGTFVERRFKEYLSQRYSLEVGNVASGLDLPSINTDIKVTSETQPQSSCPYKESKQKIYGLGYNLIVFVYRKLDDNEQGKSALNYKSCTFINAERTADYQTTTQLLELIKNDANVDDVYAFLYDHNIPADDVTLVSMAKEILANPPKIGYLTISNALQWRLQYSRVISLKEHIDGIVSIYKA